MKFGAALIGWVLVAPPAFADCLKFAPAKVTLTGVIRTRVDFGPPNYGEDLKHDSKEEHLYLHLDKSVCIEADPASESEAVKKTRLMEMVYFIHQPLMVYFIHQPFKHEWLGKHVSVTGTLFHAITGHHWTPALITPTETHILGLAQ